MTVHYAFLAFAVLLLWFPRNWLRHGVRVMSDSSRRRGRASGRDLDDPGRERDPRDRAVRPLEEAAKSRNWIDLLRASVGAYALTEAALRPPPGTEGLDAATAVCQGAVLFVGMLMQTVRVEGRVGLFAPIFYLQGMTIGVAGGLVGLLAMTGAWALSPVLPGAGAILFVQGGVAFSLGLMLQRPGTEPVSFMILTGVIWMPVLMSVLLRKRISASFDKRVKVVGRGERERGRARDSASELGGRAEARGE